MHENDRSPVRERLEPDRINVHGHARVASLSIHVGQHVEQGAEGPRHISKGSMSQAGAQLACPRSPLPVDRRLRVICLIDERLHAAVHSRECGAAQFYPALTFSRHVFQDPPRGVL